MSSQPKDQKQSMLDTLLANIIHSSAIEGEKLNAFLFARPWIISLVFLENHFQPLNALMVISNNVRCGGEFSRLSHWKEYSGINDCFPEGYTMFNP